MYASTMNADTDQMPQCEIEDCTDESTHIDTVGGEDLFLCDNHGEYVPEPWED